MKGKRLMRASGLIAGVLAASLAGFGALAGEKPTGIPVEPQELLVIAHPINSFQVGDPAQKRFGALEWVGGVSLSSSYKAFGGFSALRFLDGAGQRFLAISDAGVWLLGTLNTKGEVPNGVRDTTMGVLKNPAGVSMAGTWRGDSEGFALKGLEAYVSFEATNVVWKYTLDVDGLTGTPKPVEMPAGIKQQRFTRGLESLDVFPSNTPFAGGLLAIGESPVRGEENMRGWIVGGPAPMAFHIARSNDYDITDVALLPNGDALILERKVRIPLGIWSRIRRIPVGQFKASGLLDGPVIFEADMSQVIDNMEGIAVHRGGDGATYVTLISDDNYSMLQRTLLLRFRLLD